jgi:hypothetical protein
VPNVHFRLNDISRDFSGIDAQIRRCMVDFTLNTTTLLAIVN